MGAEPDYLKQTLATSCSKRVCRLRAAPPALALIPPTPTTPACPPARLPTHLHLLHHSFEAIVLLGFPNYILLSWFTTSTSTVIDHSVDGPCAWRSPATILCNARSSL